MKNLTTFLGAVVVAISLLLATTAEAQTPMAGANIGQRVNPDDARMVARGGWGMAVADTTHPGFKNIASLTYLRHVVLKYTGYGELTNSDSDGAARKTSGVYSPGLQFALPIMKNKMGMTAGFSMTGSTRWDAEGSASWVVDGTEVEGGFVTIREGTRFKVPLGLAYRVAGGLSLSGAVNLESGSILENYSESFDADSEASLNLKESKDLFRGTSFTLGMLWKPSERLSLGASWTPAYDLGVDRTVKGFAVTARFADSWDMHMPEEIRAGFQYRFTNRWQLGADAQYMPFSKFSGNDDWSVDMEDEQTLGFGLERLKANERRAGMRNLPLRLGANYHRWGYRVGGEPIDEYTFSVGTGFAFGRNLGQMDVSFSYGIIGDVGKNGAQSDVYRLGVSVTGLEAWW